MSAEWELRDFLLQNLNKNCDLMAHINGVYDEGLISAAPPYISLLSSLSSDWSSKSFKGREVRLSIALHSAEQEYSPDTDVLNLIEDEIESMSALLPSYKIINQQFLRSRGGRNDDGRWVMMLDYRFRLQRY